MICSYVWASADWDVRAITSPTLFPSTSRTNPTVSSDSRRLGQKIEWMRTGIAALTTPAAANCSGGDVVFRRFSDEILTANTGLAYFGEPLSPILKSLRQFLAETFQPLREGWDGQKQMVLF